jgi:UDP-N-acetylmuramoylalanine--D-glutamate ligase
MSTQVINTVAKVAVINDEHSLEFVAEKKGVTFINDSRSTSIKASVSAINALQANLVLLIGGEDRQVDYGFLLNAELAKVKAVIYLGREKERLFNVMQHQNCLITNAHSLQEAVELSTMIATANDVVLFSPACPSFEAFDNYKNRGNRFKAFIHQLN